MWPFDTKKEKPKKRSRVKRGQAWSSMEETKLRTLCRARPRLTYREIARKLGTGRSIVAVQQHAHALGLGQNTILWPPCDMDGVRRKSARRGCKCNTCESKREMRRSRSMFKCAGCGTSNIILGRGANVKVYELGKEPGGFDNPVHTKLKEYTQGGVHG